MSSISSVGGATGKIKAEYMICDCRYDHSKNRELGVLFVSLAYSLFPP